jgi:hypothetical protein
MVPICIFAPMGGFGHHVRWMALLDDRFQKPGPALTVQEKVDFISGSVYKIPDPHTYIDVETQHSVGLNDLIYFNHQLDKENRVVRLKNQHNQQFFEYSKDTKFLCCICDPQIALKEYRVLRPELNDWTPEQFLERAEVDNILSTTTIYFHENTFYINNDILHYERVLDREYYNTLIYHLELDDNYEAAAAIHETWWDLRRSFEESVSA